MAVVPIARPMIVLRNRALGSAERTGEEGCSSSTANTMAEIMKSPRPAASMKYSGQLGPPNAFGLRSDEFDNMAVEVADEEVSGALIRRQGGDQAAACADKLVRRDLRVVGRHDCAPGDEVVEPCHFRQRASIVRRKVFKELYTGTAGDSQGRDAQVGAEDVVQVLLLRAVVLRRPRHAQPERVAIEGEAARGVGDHDGRVVYA